MRVALIGHGTWGAKLAGALAELDVLACVCDLDRRALDAASAVHRNIEVSREPGRAFADDVDAVALATPSQTHAELALAALARGKHVFCEKPLATSLSDALRVRDAARAAGRIVQVGHVLEFSPAVASLRARLAGGACGAIVEYEAVRLQPADGRGDRDPLWDLAVHDVGLLLRTLGVPVERVSARVSAPSGVELSLRLADGARARVLAGYDAATRVRSTTVRGRDGTLALDELSGVLVEERDGARRTTRCELDRPLERELRAFVVSVRSETAPIVGVEHGVEVVRVVEAAARSRANGGAACAPSRTRRSAPLASTEFA